MTAERVRSLSTWLAGLFVSGMLLIATTAMPPL
jgi:hypothetical protein